MWRDGARVKRATIIAIIGIILALFIIFRFKERLFGRPAVVAGSPNIPPPAPQTPSTTSSAEPIVTSSRDEDPLVAPSPPEPNREIRKERRREIQVDQPKPQLTHGPGSPIDIASTRIRIMENLDVLRASRLAAESTLAAAMARQEQTINDTPEDIGAASDAVKHQRTLLQEAEASERSAQTAASEELSRLLAEYATEQASTSQAAFATLHGLIAEVGVRQRELEESIARRNDRDAAHDTRIAELIRLTRQKTTPQEIVQTPPPQEKRFTSPPTPSSKIAAGTSQISPATARLRYSIIVDAFENQTENSTLGTDWATLLSSELHESGRLIVVSQTKSELTALKERLRSLSGNAARSQLAPAQLLVRGVITHFENNSTDQGGGIKLNAGRKKTEVHVTLQVIDTTTGMLVAAKNFIGNTTKRAFSTGPNSQSANMADDADIRAAFERALSEATPWIVSKLDTVPWRGSVVKRDKDLVVINRGSREGVAVGDILFAGESEILRHPETGEVLDEELRQRTRLRVIKVTERASTCIALDGDMVVTGMTIWYADSR
jgi:curli biogenesis system outer membrane secretion channel CsgG